MERCSTLLVIREMQIKTIKRYYFTSTRMAIIKKQKITSVGEDAEKLQPSYTAGGNVKSYNHFGGQYGSSSKC